MIARIADVVVHYLTPSSRLIFTRLVLGAWLAAPMACAFGAEPPQAAPLRVAVYDVPPYGYANPDGSFSGISVDL
jgi:ABC-type amino acid transport substrate-binding protein